jgi:predicted DCC family thiol-disulfide oxidoreductase YuxK
MNQNIVFFDGVCNLCSGVVQWLIKRDKKNVLSYAPLQGSTAASLLPNSEFQKMDSIVFFHQGKFYHKSTAVLKILQVLSFPYTLGIVLFIFPRFIRDFVYDWVAKNRYQWFGRKAECWLPDQDLLSKFKP